MSNQQDAINGLTHEQNADRLEDLFSAAVEALFDVKDCLSSPNEILAIIRNAELTFSQINAEYLKADKHK